MRTAINFSECQTTTSFDRYFNSCNIRQGFPHFLRFTSNSLNFLKYVDSLIENKFYEIEYRLNQDEDNFKRD